MTGKLEQHWLKKDPPRKQGGIGPWKVLFAKPDENHFSGIVQCRSEGHAKSVQQKLEAEGMLTRAERV